MGLLNWASNTCHMVFIVFIILASNKSFASGKVGNDFEEQTLNLSSLHKYQGIALQSYKKSFRALNNVSTNTIVASPDGKNHDHGVGTFTSGEPITGTTAIVGVWEPYVAPSDGYSSLAQVWLSSQNLTETMEAGWHIFPQRYNDARPRLFTYWTADKYVNTGCYNTDCPGFVLLNHSFLNGQPLGPVSEYEKVVYEIPISIRLSTLTNGTLVWYLTVDKTVVGYWPASLFKAIRESVFIVHYGGEVSSAIKETGQTLSRTDMGSGRFPDPSKGWKHAAFIRQIQLYGANGATINDIQQKKYASRPTCYDAVVDQDDGFGGLHVFYGGPGGDANGCVY